MSSEKYVKNAVTTVEDLLNKDGDGYHLKTTVREPVPHSYKPELDIINELNLELMSRYRQLIGILQWAVELGRIDIYHEIAILSQYLASPRKGHLEALYHIFVYLKRHQKFSLIIDPKDVQVKWAVELGRIDIYHEIAILSQYLASPRKGHLEALYHIFVYLKRHQKFSLIIDPKDVQVSEDAFSNVDICVWQDFYGEVLEEIPPRMPEPLGNAVDITCFVDSDHTGNVVTRCSHTRIIMFLQNAPIIWHPKKQNTVESSSFSSEFIALRVAWDMIVPLCYKLRMFGVPLKGPTVVLCNNQGIVKNASLPDSTLAKRCRTLSARAISRTLPPCD